MLVSRQAQIPYSILFIIFNYYNFHILLSTHNKSTLPNTESIDPITAIRSPKLIYLIYLFDLISFGLFSMLKYLSVRSAHIHFTLISMSQNVHQIVHP